MSLRHKLVAAGVFLTVCLVGIVALPTAGAAFGGFSLAGSRDKAFNRVDRAPSGGVVGRRPGRDVVPHRNPKRIIQGLRVIQGLAAIQGSRECPPDTTGRPPNCKRVNRTDNPRVCPPGTVGRPPRCKTVVADTRPPRHCRPGTIGKWPKCRPIHVGHWQSDPVVVVEPEPDRPNAQQQLKRQLSAGNRRSTIKTTPPVELASPPPPPQAAALVPRFRPAELVVVVRGAQPDDVATQLSNSFNLTLRETVNLALLPDTRVFRFSIPDNRSVEVLAAAISNTPNVSATPNFYHVLQAGSGKRTKSQPEPELQYALPKMHVPAAQKLATGRGAVIAVIDSGVDAHHPAFTGVDLTVIDVAEDGVQGVDKHGTAITGIIAARGEMKGIAPDAAIIAVRAFAPEREGEQPVTTSLRLARAVDMAFQKGARIFNMSFAGPRDQLLIDIIDAAHAKGGTFVAAAGNEGPNAPPAFPAAYEKVIAITATDEADHVYAYANRGQYVAAAAPGVDIWVPVTGEGFDYLSGTSFAAAHVTGIVALLHQRNPELSQVETRRILMGTARSLPQDGKAQDTGAGLADALASVREVQTLANKK